MPQKNKESEEANRVILISNIRWTALSSIAAIILLTFLVGLKFSLLNIIYLLLLIIFYNMAFIFLARHNPPICRSIFCIYFQFLCDLLAVTALVHYTGGIESPFILLYLLFPTIVALFFGSSFAIFIAGHAVILFAWLNRLESLGILRHHTIALPSIIIYRDMRFIFLYIASFFFICLALIYAVSYLSEKFREKQKQIEDISAEKMDFMNDVAHELKNPLTSIKEYVSLFLEGALGEVPQNQREILEVVDRQARRMVSMISDLLNLSRIESNKARFEMKDVNLYKLIDSAATDLLPQFIEKKLKLVQNADPDIPPIRMDEIKMLEVLINLLSNAIKFSSEGGKIYLQIKRSPGQVAVSVRDEGQGIETQDIPHIFEKFYRASKESAKPKGTGLGLALSRSIVESHGGKMWAESQGRGRGATFYFTLPVK